MLTTMRVRLLFYRRSNERRSNPVAFLSPPPLNYLPDDSVCGADGHLFFLVPPPISLAYSTFIHCHQHIIIRYTHSAPISLRQEPLHSKGLNLAIIAQASYVGHLLTRESTSPRITRRSSNKLPSLSHSPRVTRESIFYTTAMSLCRQDFSPFRGGTCR